MNRSNQVENEVRVRYMAFLEFWNTDFKGSWLCQACCFLNTIKTQDLPEQAWENSVPKFERGRREHGKKKKKMERKEYSKEILPL